MEIYVFSNFVKITVEYRKLIQKNKIGMLNN